MAYTQTTESIQKLQSQVAGSVLTSDSTDYETTRHGFNLSIDQHPALILVPANVQDIVFGVNFAREQGLGISVQVTGHGIQHPADNALLIVPTRLNTVRVDAASRRAHAQGGALWQDVLEQATPHGLAPLMGTAPAIGVVGYTLGGGIGWLSRKYGLAVDAVRSVDIVTPDGVLRHASADENSDLFWAVRGGGGNFGVVTEIEFELFPVTKVYGGVLTYAGESARDVLTFFRDWVQTAPDELTAQASVFKFPNIPQMPEPMRGKLFAYVRAAYAGSESDGAKVMQAWLDWRAPQANDFREIPFADIGKITNDPTAPMATYSSSEMFETLSDEAIDIIVSTISDPKTPLIFVDLRHVGGAIARVDGNSAAVANRAANFYFQANGAAPVPQAREAIAANVAHLHEQLKPYTSGGVYQNFMAGAEAEKRTQDAYGDHFERLEQVKAKYDPDNQLRYSYQIVPPENAKA